MTWKPIAAFTLLLAAGCASFPRSVANRVVDRWSGPSAAAGAILLDQYGVPDDVTPNKLTWRGRGGWKRTVVFNRRPVYRTPADLAVMEQTVDYPLDLMQAVRLLAFSDNLVIDLARGELSSRGGHESINFLRLNLADEIARGVTTVPDAQAAYRRIIALSAAGKSSPYLEKLLFSKEG